MPQIQQRKLTPLFGTEVEGIDLTGALGDDVLSLVRGALLDRGMLVVKAAGLTPDQLLSLARQFGQPELHVFHPSLGPGYEHVQLLDSYEQAPASTWHTDESFLPAPPAVTLLYSKIIPPTGGDTCFADLAGAYDALSGPMKRYLDGVEAIHDLAKLRLLEYRNGRISATEAADSLIGRRWVSHPVVRVHPVSGRPSLFVNPLYTTHIVGVSPAESVGVLDYLYQYSSTPPFALRHRWSVGDLVIWDNRRSMHMALGDYEGHRQMNRVSVLEGEAGRDLPARDGASEPVT